MNEPTPNSSFEGPEDNRPARCFLSNKFMIGKIIGDDDFRLAVYVGEIGRVVKWLAPDGKDLGFTRAELVELCNLLGRALNES